MTTEIVLWGEANSAEGNEKLTKIDDNCGNVISKWIIFSASTILYVLPVSSVFEFRNSFLKWQRKKNKRKHKIRIEVDEIVRAVPLRSIQFSPSDEQQQQKLIKIFLQVNKISPNGFKIDVCCLSRHRNHFICDLIFRSLRCACST